MERWAAMFGKVEEQRRRRRGLCGARSIDNFKRLNEIEEGTYGVVFRGKDLRTGDIVALKRLKLEAGTTVHSEGFPITSLREIYSLMNFRHVNIVAIKEVVVGRHLDMVFIVMDFVDHDIKALLDDHGLSVTSNMGAASMGRRSPFTEGQVKRLLHDLLSAVAFLHGNWILHRDLKPTNLLYSNSCGRLLLADFGLARKFGEPIIHLMTPLVQTLWYRAPELLLGEKNYSTAVDCWSVGCVFAELIIGDSLFKGKSELDQLHQIFKVLGVPNDTIWPAFSSLPGLASFKISLQQPYNNIRQKLTANSGVALLSDKGIDLMNRLLTFDPAKRITADKALRHPWFKELPLMTLPQDMPKWPSKAALESHLRKSPPPSSSSSREEKRYKLIL